MITTLNLITLCRYFWDGSADPSSVRLMEGATDFRFDDANGNRLQILAGSCAFAHHGERIAKTIPPFAGVTALYGDRPSVEEVRHWRIEALKTGSKIAMLTFQIEITDFNRSTISLESIRDSGDRTMFFRRASTDLQQRAYEYVSKFLKDDPRTETTRPLHRISMLALYPDLLVRWLLEDPEMANIDVAILPVVDDPKKAMHFRQFAFIRPGIKIGQALQGQIECDLFLPAWMSDKALAEKLAAEAGAKK